MGRRVRRVRPAPGGLGGDRRVADPSRHGGNDDMGKDPIELDAIPDWFLEVVQVMQETERSTRTIDNALRYALGLEGLDGRLRDDLQYARDSLGAVKVALSVLEMKAQRVLSEMAEVEQRPRRLA
jgi:hypothetical protein